MRDRGKIFFERAALTECTTSRGIRVRKNGAAARGGITMTQFSSLAAAVFLKNYFALFFLFLFFE